jgi:hypothetical protein
MNSLMSGIAVSRTSMLYPTAPTRSEIVVVLRIAPEKEKVFNRLNGWYFHLRRSVDHRAAAEP